MDVRAKQRLSYQRLLFNSELRGGGFAPRHLNRSMLSFIMDKIAIIDSLKSCLGKRLVSAKRRLYDVEEIAVEDLDLAEVAFGFDAPDTVRYFSWVQTGNEFVLSVRKDTHLVDGSRPEISAEDDILLSKLLGKRLTLFELYEDEFGSVVAVMLRFENESCVVAVGHETWDDERKTAEFRFFSGDDLYLWTEENFVEALGKHKLEVAAREENKVFL